MPITVATVREGFLYLSIDTHPALTTYANITEIHTKLKINSASSHSNLGGEQYGLIDLILQDSIYTTLIGLPFILPTKPGTVPDIPAGSSDPQILQLERAHKKAFRRWQETIKCQSSITITIISISDEEYLGGLSNMHMHYVGVSTMIILQHSIVIRSPPPSILRTTTAP